jgi:YVTN family beta-propeller protein
MKSKIATPLLSFLVALIFFSSCQQKDLIKGKYESGVLIVNEGAFGSGNGDVTYYGNASGAIQQSIFKLVNGYFAGDVLESISVDGDNGYLVLNGSNKIEIIDINSFKLNNTFTDPLLINPRYLQVINGKSYISVWGSYDQYYSLIKSYVLVMDNKSLQLVDTIGTDIGVENLLYDGKHLFASNFNYGGSNTVNVIDPTTDKSIKKITLYAGPGGMALDANNKLWIIAQGTYLGNDGKLFCVNTTTFSIEKTIELGLNPSNPDLAISPDKKSLYYYSGPAIYKIGIDATGAPASSWVLNADIVAPYALGVDPKTGDVYLGDALNYSSEGKVYVYGVDAKLKTSFTAGINPGQFIFK